MNLARVLLLTPLVCGTLFADSIRCSSGSAYGGSLSPIACSSLTDLIGFNRPPYSAGFTVSGNTVSGGSGAISLGSVGPFTGEEEAVVSFEDTITIPKSSAGDVFKITAGGEFLNSPGTGASGKMTAGPYSYQTVWTHCLLGSCIDHATISADSISSLTVQGELSLYVYPYFNDLPNGVGLYFYEDITLERFKADGLTPDVFTPEPSSCGLALCGLMALGLVGFVRIKQTRLIKC